MKTNEDVVGSDKRRFTLFAMVFFVGFGAAFLMYWITAQGPGVSNDSTVYIDTARNLLAGKGLLVDDKPMNHYPPFYPMMLGLVGLFTQGDILLAARILASMFYGINAALLVTAVGMCTGNNLVAMVGSLLLFIFSEPVIVAHSMAWSEAPYIAFSTATFMFLARYIERRRRRHLVLASMMIGIAASTRYVGYVLFPTAAVALVLLNGRIVRTKIAEVVFLSAVAGLPVLLWLTRNVLIAQSATNRDFVFHPMNINHLKGLIVSPTRFLFPLCLSLPGLNRVVIIIANLLLISAIFTLICICSYKAYANCIARSRSGVPCGRSVLPKISVIYCVLYTMFIFITILFFDASTPTDERILLPVFFAMIVAFAATAVALSRVWSRKWVWSSCALFLLLFLLLNVSHAKSTAIAIQESPRGYTGRQWRESETIAFLRSIPEGVHIYSNCPEIIRFYLQKKAIRIPMKVDPLTSKVNLHFSTQMNQMVRKCEKAIAIIVIFKKERWYLPSKGEIEPLLIQCSASVMQDGVVYGLPKVQNENVGN